jgi:hypothetical protein
MTYDKDKAKRIGETAMEDIGKLIEMYNAALFKCGYILAINTTSIGQYTFDIRRLLRKEAK